MKRWIGAALLAATAAALAACSPSTVVESTEAGYDEIIQGYIVSKDTTAYMTLPESSKYTIPEGAETGEHGGPGAMETTEVDYSYYPPDKQPVETEYMGMMIILYVPGSGGLSASFDYVDTIDAESLIQAMIRNNALTADIEMEGFELSEDGRSAVLYISDSTAVYSAASDEEVVTAVANTFIDNFGLDEIDMVVAGDDLGYRGYSQEFDAKKSK